MKRKMDVTLEKSLDDNNELTNDISSRPQILLPEIWKNCIIPHLRIVHLAVLRQTCRFFWTLMPAKISGFFWELMSTHISGIKHYVSM